MLRAKVAELNGWTYSTRILQDTSHAIIEHFANDSSLDVLLGDFTLTWKRLNRYNVSFSMPFVSKGLLLMRKTPRTHEDGWWIVKSFTDWCWATFFLFVFISAFVIWLCEHWELLTFRYVYAHFCCCVPTPKSDKTDIRRVARHPREGMLSRTKSSKSVGDIEMTTNQSSKSDLLSSCDSDDEAKEPEEAPPKKPKFMPVC